MADAPTLFVVLTAPRTGSTLLVHMLDSHADIIAAGEYFNENLVGKGVIDFPAPEIHSDEELLALRQADPVAFVKRMNSEAAARGAKAAGYKLIYGGASDARMRPFLDDLLGVPGIRVIHMRRRNLLRQYLSLKVAAKTGVWHRRADEDARSGGHAKVRLEFEEMVDFFQRMQRQWRAFEERIADCESICVDYEDLAEDPVGEVARLQAFLGVTPQDVEVTHRKTARGSLHETIENFDELKGSLAEWAAFFDVPDTTGR